MRVRSDAPFLRSGLGVHFSIDKQLLRDFYSAQELKERYPQGYYLVHHISSPWDLYIWDKYRSDLALPMANRVPCDVFVWGYGPAPDYRMTRIGGAPSGLASADIPRRRGVCATMIAQIAFDDSLDIVGATLPAMSLAVFAYRPDRMLSSDNYECRWIVGDRRVCANRKEYDPEWHVVQAYGVRFRSCDFGAVDESDIDRRDTQRLGLWKLPIYSATKIGGVCSNGPSNMVGGREELFLGQVGSVVVSAAPPYPWTNRKEPMDACGPDSVHADKNCLRIGDLGVACLSLRGGDEVVVRADWF